MTQDIPQNSFVGVLEERIEPEHKAPITKEEVDLMTPYQFGRWMAEYAWGQFKAPKHKIVNPYNLVVEQELQRAEFNRGVTEYYAALEAKQ